MICWVDVYVLFYILLDFEVDVFGGCVLKVELYYNVLLYLVGYVVI